MKQYKLVIKDLVNGQLNGIVNHEAKRGWKLNSYERSIPAASQSESGRRQRLFMVFER